jgi:hypothetical protein
MMSGSDELSHGLLTCLKLSWGSKQLNANKSINHSMRVAMPNVPLITGVVANKSMQTSFFPHVVVYCSASYMARASADKEEIHALPLSELISGFL